MATTEQYLNQLVEDKNNIITKLQEKGVEVSENATFTDLNVSVDELSKPTGELEITENGEFDVSNYASANVNVESGGGSNFAEFYSATTSYSTSTYRARISEAISEVPKIDVTGTKYFTYFFNYCRKVKKIDTTDYDVSLATNFDYMFAYCPLLEEIVGLNTWVFDKVNTMQYMFISCTSLKEVIFTSLTISPMSSGLANMFYNCQKLKKVNLKNMVNRIGDSSKSTSIMRWFYNCYLIEEIWLDSFDFSTIEYYTNAFGSCGINLPEGQLTKVYVKDETAQSYILGLGSSDRPASWSTANVIIAGSENDLREV